MRPELAVASPVPTAAGPAGPLTGLTRRASLNAGALLLDYAVKIGVRLVVTPILLGALGRTLFGVWEMLQRLATYVSPADGRSTEALRLVIAQRQTDPDDAVKRRYVGAAIVVWMLLLPLIAGIGVAFVWLAPLVTRVPAGQAGEVRLTSGLLIVTFLLTTLWSVPESVLRGMNLSYKRMGVQAGLNVLGGALMVAAVWGGLGLAGLGGAEALRALATGLCFWVLVRSYVRWFGVARPTRREVRTLFGMSLWLMTGDLVAKALLASDVIILGALLGPAVVTTYVLTGYAARTVVGVHVFTAQAAVPGFGGLLGRGERARAGRARDELLLLTWLFTTVAGCGILLWNPSFVALWVGGRNYAGGAVDLLLVLLAVQTAFIRVDAYLIDAGLRPRVRVLIGAVTAAVTIAAALGLTARFGLIGLCGGMLAGRTIQSVAYPLLAARIVGTSEAAGPGAGRLARLLLVTVLLFAGSAILGPRLAMSAWPVWIAGVVLSVPLVTGVALAAGPDAGFRRTLIARLRALLPGGGGG